MIQDLLGVDEIDFKDNVLFDIAGRKIFEVKGGLGGKIAFLLCYYPIRLTENVTQEEFDKCVDKVKERLIAINTLCEVGQFPFEIVPKPGVGVSEEYARRLQKDNGDSDRIPKKSD